MHQVDSEHALGVPQVEREDILRYWQREASTERSIQIDKPDSAFAWLQVSGRLDPFSD